MQEKVDQLIKEAEKFLNEQAFDKAHGLKHHQQVLKNVQHIAKDMEEEIDMISLQIASMWHDVVTKRKRLGKKRAKRRTAKYVAKRMKELGFPSTTIKKTKTAILEHSVMNTQTIIESKILADADLLEWFNPNRFKKSLRIYTTGRAKKIKWKAFRYFAKKWLKELPHLIHFESTRRSFYKKIEDFKKDSEINKLVREQGEKIDNYLKIFY